jgi:hypothetical protein
MAAIEARLAQLDRLIAQLRSSIASSGSSGGGGSGAVSSVFGRTGAVTAQGGDYTAAQVGAAATVHSHAQSDVTGLAGALAAKEATANKGVAGGYAGLDGTGKVPSTQLPTMTATVDIKTADLDFGWLGIGAGSKIVATAIITDAGVSPTSQITVLPSGEVPTGETAQNHDEQDMDPLSYYAVAGTGQFTVYARAVEPWGRVYGKRRINYLIG